jgi:hypothetical protein
MRTTVSCSEPLQGELANHPVREPPGSSLMVTWCRASCPAYTGGGVCGSIPAMIRLAPRSNRGSSRSQSGGFATQRWHNR